MSVVMKVTYDRYTETLFFQAFYDVRDGFSRAVIIYSDSHYLTAGSGEGRYLFNCAGDVRGVGIGHRLHHDWCSASHTDTTNDGGRSFSALDFGHSGSLILSRRIGRPILCFTARSG